LCFHGSPHSYNGLITWETPEAQLERYQAGTDAHLLAGGHTHAQMMRRCREFTWINPGSVGLCYECRSNGRAHNVPWAKYKLMDWQAAGRAIRFPRVPLDLETVRQAAVQAARLDDMPLAEWCASERSA
jgi:hypothetical protein